MSGRVRDYFPDRFVGARFVDPTKHIPRTVYIDDDNSDTEDALPEQGTYSAAASASTATRKRRRESDEGRDDEAALEQAEKKNQSRYTKRDVDRMLRQTHAVVLRAPPQPEVAGDTMHVTNERAWLSYQVKLVEQIATQVPMVAACISVLKNLVMSDGLKFMRENIELVPSRDFNEYTLRRLHPFAYSCIDHMLMVGVIPVVFELDPVTGQRWPYVPALGTYIIKRYTVRGAVRYRFYWSDETSYRSNWQRQAIQVRDGGGYRWTARRECGAYGVGNDGNDPEAGAGIYDPTVQVIHNLGHEISSTGALTSRLASLMMMAYHRMRTQRARTIAEANTAAPPIVTEFDHSAEAQQARAFSTGYYASVAAPPEMDAADQPEAIESIAYKRTLAEQDRFAALMRYYEQTSGRDASTVFDVPHETYRNDLGGQAVTQPRAVSTEGVQAPWANQYHVTSTRKLARIPDAHIATDYVNVLAYMDDEVCGVLGVPKTYVLGTAVRAGTELVTNRLSDEIRALKKAVSDVLTHIYNVLFVREDVGGYMSDESRAARGAGPLLTEDDLYVIDAIKRVRVTFAKKPTDTPQELFQLFAIGGIDQQVLCAELARRNNFDPAQICQQEPEEEIPLQMRRMLIPAFAEYYKLQSDEKKHKDDVKLKKDQSEQQMAMKSEDNQLKEKIAKTNAVAKEKAAATASKEKSAAAAVAPKATPKEPASGPSLSEISKAASTLAAAGAAVKKAAKSASEGESKSNKRGT